MVIPRSPATHCDRCGITLRRHSEPKAEGTRLFAGKGMCSTCRSRDTRGSTPKEPTATHCAVCRVPLRVRSAPDDGVTEPHQGNGQCLRCYRRLQSRQLRKEAAWIRDMGLGPDTPAGNDTADDTASVTPGDTEDDTEGDV